MSRATAEVIIIALAAEGVTALLTLTSCARPPVPVTLPPGVYAAPLCDHAPLVIHYGSCGKKLAPGPASCVLCEGARGCMAYPGVLCAGALACDDPACR